jgi:2-keto-4-pentenoate hydratase/2-oxohepta-3-ene-1,7-dioic acid hydratase in catechol pathway
MKVARIGERFHERTIVSIDGNAWHNAEDFCTHPEVDLITTKGLEIVGKRLTESDTSGFSFPNERIGAPIPRPGKIVCIGLNYADHAAESGMPIPEEPIVFFKASNTMIGPNDNVYIPRTSKKTDWEVELGIVIGQECRYLESPQDSLSHIAGFVLSNDVSEREFQLERGGQWVKGKSCETFNPCGPWLVTSDEIGDFDNLGMWLEVNGTRRQIGSTTTMIFNVPHIVWYLSQFMVLEPGDLINTGTPPGVGMGMKPPTYLKAGDVMTLGIDGLGSQRQLVQDAP